MSDTEAWASGPASGAEGFARTLASYTRGTLALATIESPGIRSVIGQSGAPQRLDIETALGSIGKYTRYRGDMSRAMAKLSDP